MREFNYKWVTLIKAILFNFLRNLAILKNYFFNNKTAQDHSSYYKNLDILDDDWFTQLPKQDTDQIKFLKKTGIKSYILETLFYDHIIKNNSYDSVIDFGCGNGRLTSVLAANNPQVSFHCFDINKYTRELNEIYLLENLVFEEKGFQEYKTEGKTLVIARMSLAYLNPKELNQFLEFCLVKNYDIGIADITRFRLNQKTKISYTQNSQPVFAHPYSIILSNLGFEIIIDIQKESALMNFTTYLFPEFLNCIYATKN